MLLADRRYVHTETLGTIERRRACVVSFWMYDRQTHLGSEPRELPSTWVAGVKPALLVFPARQVWIVARPSDKMLKHFVVGTGGDPGLSRSEILRASFDTSHLGRCRRRRRTASRIPRSLKSRSGQPARRATRGRAAGPAGRSGTRGGPAISRWARRASAKATGARAQTDSGASRTSRRTSWFACRARPPPCGARARTRSARAAQSASRPHLASPNGERREGAWPRGAPRRAPSRLRGAPCPAPRPRAASGSYPR